LLDQVTVAAAPRARGPEALGQDEGVDVAGIFSTARIWVAPFRQADVCPVASTSGVVKPLQTHPLTVTGAPPPLPRTLPEARARA
jgi:hypothetical protein